MGVTGKITPDMTVLDIVGRFRSTEVVFKRHDRAVGECICCQSLFDPLKTVAEKYNLDLAQLIRELEAEADHE